METSGKNAQPQQAGNITPQILIWGGVLLTLLGGLLALPYIRSRLATVPVAPTTVAEGYAPPTPTPTPTEPAPPPTEAIDHAGTAVPSPTPLPPTSTPAPMPPTRIVIPDIDVDAPVEPVSQQIEVIDGQPQGIWEVLNRYAVGWHDTSAALAVPGNTVLNGHNTTYGEVFRDLYTLDPGTPIRLYSADKPYTYTVAEVLILPEAGQPLEVRVENAKYILPTEDERVTLVTCHPYGSLRNRLIVIAYPEDISKGQITPFD